MNSHRVFSFSTIILFADMVEYFQVYIQGRMNQMSLIQRIQESFENGEDFNFMANDMEELNALSEKMNSYEETLQAIRDLNALKYQLVDAQYLALIALKDEHI